MERFYHLFCLACLLSSVLWTIKGTYYVKPTGRYEITEIPLPSSVIEQINKNNMQATLNPGQVTPTVVPTSATKNVQLPQALGPGCSFSESPVISFSRTIQTGSSATPGPSLIPPMLPVAQVQTGSSAKPGPTLIPPMLPVDQGSKQT
ncbi:uncharacterized protein LOC110066516 isoform X2 [Orbicella faveolata]|uniref:uncharacterized protein LOC110066516 isoform X2 n=1 Tax=Orbicella faveolata TaxID=48498 RepID=UPI0009E5BB45|nr:uncharacterized protein LOC110066516 isoform X2 [Orbicella faveolata]